jgi:two-component system copper resistance phosphate regulon response regulator CusR
VKILLIEDDIVISDQIARYLQKERFHVETKRSGPRGEQAALSSHYDLIILDIMLPERDGWTVCENLRRAHLTTPILMLTARDSVEDRIKGLEGGADDYLPKPFDVRELMARIQALLRRDKIHRTGRITVADLEIDTRAHTVVRGGVEIALTNREFSLLEALARNEGRTLTREAIVERVWANEDNLPNSVNFHIASLRKKIDAEFEPKLIHTVYGIGYVLKVQPG